MAEMAHDAFAHLLAIIKAPDHVEVPVGKTSLALVDPEDYEMLVRHDWFLSSGYAVAQMGSNTVSMHRLVMGKHAGNVVDHVDGNRLNNCRANLRSCSFQENSQNRHTVVGRSKFKGVRRDRGYWRADLRKSGKLVHLGLFATERLAARAYDKAATTLFGKFAKTNADLGLF